MKRNITYILLPIILLSYFIISCSGSEPILVDKKQEEKPILSEEDSKKKALEFFINGGVYESQGNYEAAIKQYEKALQYDSSAGMFYTIA